MNATKTGRETAALGGYGILASLDREAAGGTVRDVGQRDSRGARHALVAGAALVALLAWWWCSNSAPAVALPPKPVWHAPVARPALAPVAAHDAPAPIVNDAPAVPAVHATPPAVARQVAVAAPPRRERVAAHAPIKPVRRDVVRAAAPAAVHAAAAPPDHDVSLLTALVAHQNGIALPSRDVVEPHLADSTAALLQRCGRVGGEEGRLCRARICAGRQTDAGCAGD